MKDGLGSEAIYASFVTPRIKPLEQTNLQSPEKVAGIYPSSQDKKENEEKMNCRLISSAWGSAKLIEID